MLSGWEAERRHRETVVSIESHPRPIDYSAPLLKFPQACEHLHATDGGHVVQYVLGQEAPRLAHVNLFQKKRKAARMYLPL